MKDWEFGEHRRRPADTVSLAEPCLACKWHNCALLWFSNFCPLVCSGFVLSELEYFMKSRFNRNASTCGQQVEQSSAAVLSWTGLCCPWSDRSRPLRILFCRAGLMQAAPSHHPPGSSTDAVQFALKLSPLCGGAKAREALLLLFSGIVLGGVCLTHSRLLLFRRRRFQPPT
jgi:hypothetical protein